MRTHLRSRVPVAMLLALAFTPHAAAQATIDTYPVWNGSNELLVWGADWTPTFGQTFTADATHVVLTGMRFPLRGDGEPQNFRAYVYQWSGTNTTGPALFTSSSLLYDGSPSFQDINVSTGALALTPGQQYVAFFSTLGEAGSTFAPWGYLGTSAQDGLDGYAGGNFVFNNSPGFDGEWEDPTFYDGDASHDLAFRLSFAAVPEPSTYALVGVTTAVWLAFRWRSRRQRHSI